MKTQHATESIRPLRQYFIEDIESRKLSVKTQVQYIRPIKCFAEFYDRSPAKASEEGVRRFLLRIEMGAN